MEKTKDEIIKEAIVESAARLFQKWGLNKTTMDDIAKSAGKGKSTLYYYYSSKEEIFYVVLNKCLEAVISVAKERINSEQKAEDKLKTYIITFINEIKKYANLYDIIRGEINDQSPVVDKFRARINTEEIQLISNIIKFGIKNNEFKEYDDNDIKTLAYTFTTAIRSLLIDLYSDNKFIRDSKRINILIEILFNGIKK